MERLRGLLELTRPANAVVAGALTAIGAFVAGPGQTAGLLAATPPVVRAGAAVVATVLAVGAGNAINDYFDRAIDRVNRPDRPIPRGAVAPRVALAFAAALFLAAVAFALLLPALAVAVAVVNLAALVAYTELFKGLPGVGNAVVAYLGGSTFIFGGAAVGGDLAPVAVLAVLAALATFAREVVKDVEDVVGDREEGLSTLPIALGEKRALAVATGALVAGVLASPAPYLLAGFGPAYLLAVALADVVMLAGGYWSFADAARGQAWLKYGQLLAAGAFVVGRLA
ncbi:geranylgeranylglycerol-phosphate geranylgeranyltransferase [Halosegnis sp.]|uniref:geranylgeranylglycerol-phosphate geranylgeranyltransferase n=1 Tax=Halosegnis sp. TaxID=2864959 RepID=UPI0035D4C2FF